MPGRAAIEFFAGIDAALLRLLLAEAATPRVLPAPLLRGGTLCSGEIAGLAE